MARLTGSVAGLAKLLDRCGWQVEAERDASLPRQFTLTPDREWQKRMISGGFAPGRRR